MEILHTTEYDERIKNRLNHIKNYPQMLPFIGRKWETSNQKILLLGESHYIPGDELNAIPNVSHLTDWYNNNSSMLYSALADYLNTRKVITRADKIEEEGFHKPLSIFYNIKKELKTHISELTEEKYIFPFFSFYNYFQRPAFIEGDSIDNDSKDNEVAYNTLKYLVELIRPKKIIFISKKAKWNFDCFYTKDSERNIFNNIKIDVVPHASCVWWNRKSAAYGYLTGRQKFINLISE